MTPRAGLQLVLHGMRAVLESGRLQLDSPFWDVPEGQGEGQSSQGTGSQAMHLLVRFDWKKQWLDCVIIN